MTKRLGAWDFGYERTLDRVTLREGEREGTDAVVAAGDGVDIGRLRDAVRPLGADLKVELLLARAPLFWSRVRGPVAVSEDALAGAIAEAGIPIRYVASARTASLKLPPALDLSRAPPAQPQAWRSRAARPTSATPASPGDWFLGDGGGVRVDRKICGTGSRTRLAVIDDDACDLDKPEVESVVLVGLDRAPATSGHAARMVAWAVGAVQETGERFVGVAPDASARVYCIPKAGVDVISLPLAIARAVFDGADVVVCATYLGGESTSPMLDDALDVATHLGRRGRGTVVALPTGREASSPGDSVHASLSLGLNEPASDPRVHCVAPGGREGGWFLWRSPGGTLRPFSNRGPAVRWLAPGDDVSYPFASKQHLFHAESSGASAIAAGVLLLVLGSNPSLRLPELHAVLARTVDAPEPEPLADSPVADPADLLPHGRDRDGHNARTGYGRLNAAAACAIASDPLALAIAAIGEARAAVGWCKHEGRPYSKRCARWVVRVLLARPDLEHGVRALARHLRLLAAKPSRASGHAPEALVRQLGTFARELSRLRPPRSVRSELEHLGRQLAGALAGDGTAPGRLTDAAVRSIFADLRPELAQRLHGPVSDARAQS
jgi:hypothetical protein